MTEVEVLEDNEFNNEEMIMGGTSFFLLVSVFMIGGTLAMGVITGLTMSIGFGFLLFKLKRYCPKVWNTMIDHPLATDVIISGSFLFLLAPATATGIIAGASAGVFSSAGISIATKKIGKVKGIKSYDFKQIFKKKGGQRKDIQKNNFNNLLNKEKSNEKV